jgi:hypothetical protein
MWNQFSCVHNFARIHKTLAAWNTGTQFPKSRRGSPFASRSVILLKLNCGAITPLPHTSAWRRAKLGSGHYVMASMKTAFCDIAPCSPTFQRCVLPLSSGRWEISWLAQRLLAPTKDCTPRREPVSPKRWLILILCLVHPSHLGYFCSHTSGFFSRPSCSSWLWMSMAFTAV